MTSADSTTGAGAASGWIGARPTVRRRRLDRALAIGGVVGDLAALNLAMILAYWLRFRSGWLPVTKGEPLTRDAYLGAMVAVSVVWLAIFAGLDMYRPQRWTRVLDESYRVLIGAVGVLVAVMAMSFFYRSFEYSRLTAGIAFVIAVLLVVAQRAVGLNLAASVRRRPAFRRRVAVLAPEGAELIDGREREQAYATDRPADDYQQVLALVRDGAVDEVVLRRTSLDGDRLVTLLRECEQAGAEALVIADNVDLLLRRGGREDVAGWPLVRVRDVPMDGLQRLLKRLFDVVAASLVLVLFGWLMALIAVLVKLTSPGPVIYRQVRVTESGREFWMYKFRSMVADAEAKTGAVWASRGDPRVTPLGRFLRRSSLDELPQFWNVLLGDMSLIGPRPERPVFVEQFAAQVPRYRDRHRMKTGITGWAQITGERGGESSIEQRTRYDLFYIDNWSLLLDLQILVKTAFEVLFHRGAG